MCVFLLSLTSCGDDPIAPEEAPSSETWHFAPGELGRRILNQEPGALAWIPAGVLEKTNVNDTRQLRLLTELLSKTVVPTLTISTDGTFVLRLVAEQPDGAWRKVTALGTWRLEGTTYRLSVTKRDAPSLAPLEIDDELTVRREGAILLLDALGRAIPLVKRSL